MYSNYTCCHLNWQLAAFILSSLGLFLTFGSFYQIHWKQLTSGEA